MLNYILKRLAITVPVLFFISIGAFILVHMTPGDPVDMFTTPEMTPDQIELLRESLGDRKSVV